MNLEKIGYFDEFQKEAIPYFFLDNSRVYDRAALLDYLRSGISIVSMKENRVCRFCGLSGSDLGCSELSDGRWIWTDDLIHYVETHDIDLPPEFVEYIIDRNYQFNPSDELSDALIQLHEAFRRHPPSVELTYSNQVWSKWVKAKQSEVNEATIEKLKKSIHIPERKDIEPQSSLDLPDNW